MRNLLFILQNWHYYKIWKERVKNKSGDIYDFNRGSGYYISRDFWEDYRGQIWKTEMSTSKKTGVFKLVDYRFHSDPDDMVQEAWYEFLGYEEDKLMKDCTFEEFVQIYGMMFQKKK
ncbi:hypothetical protein [Bacillus thuringiensis]|uniref:hypothetical protein n=1 Tax=Bacillus thuringiensis TaxID=1428 RepID=UPI003F5CBAE1